MGDSFKLTHFNHFIQKISKACSYAKKTIENPWFLMTCSPKRHFRAVAQSCGDLGASAQEPRQRPIPAATQRLPVLQGGVLRQQGRFGQTWRSLGGNDLQTTRKWRKNDQKKQKKKHVKFGGPMFGSTQTSTNQSSLLGTWHMMLLDWSRRSTLYEWRANKHVLGSIGHLFLIFNSTGGFIVQDHICSWDVILFLSFPCPDKPAFHFQATEMCSALFHCTHPVARGAPSNSQKQLQSGGQKINLGAAF